MYENQNFLTKLNIDLTLLVVVLLIFMLGLFVLYSASSENVNIIIKQLIAFCIGFIAMIFLAKTNPFIFSRLSFVFYIFVLLLLIITSLFGKTTMGATRWINLGFISFQPSELAKISVPFMLSSFLSNRKLPPSYFTISISLIYIILPCILILKQPDLGTTILVLAGGCFVLFMAGLSWRLLASVGFLAIPSSFVMWSFLHDYQRKRILVFLYPESDIQGAGWNIAQAKTAVGSGGLFGKGWFNGTQSHLNFLPESHTDFIIAVLSEELGFVGVFSLLSLYFILIARSIFIALNARTSFDHLLASTISCILFIYVFINMGMVSGILPVVGVPLPFVSNGGTQIIVLLLMVGFLMSINAHKEVHL